MSGVFGYLLSGTNDGWLYLKSGICKLQLGVIPGGLLIDSMPEISAVKGCAMKAASEVPNAIKILSVEDHPMLQEGLAAVINAQSDMALVAVAGTAGEGIQSFREYHPDVTLMDLRLPDLSGIDALSTIRGEFPEARIMMLTTFDADMDILRAMRAGAFGYVLKSAPRRELVDAIRKVHAGRKYFPPEVAASLAEHLGNEALSEREVEVLHHLGCGEGNKGIAERLFISEETVKVHVKHIMEKLGASDRTHALRIALRRGIIRL